MDVLVGTWDVRSANFMELIVMTSRPLWDVMRSLLLSDTTAIFLSHLPFEKDPPKKTCARLQRV